jgi:hypothetical protein
VALSLLSPALADAAIAGAAREGAPSDLSWAAGLVKWMRSNFQLTDAAACGGGGGGGSGNEGWSGADAASTFAAALGSGGRRGGAAAAAAAQARRRLREMLRGSGSTEEQLEGCLRGRRGTAEQLNALLVALLRGLGLLVRTAWWAGLGASAWPQLLLGACACVGCASAAARHQRCFGGASSAATICGRT